MQLGALVPFHDTGGDPNTVREYAQALEAAGYDFLEAPDHVLGANAASRPGWDPDRNTSSDLFHDPFVLLSYVSGVAPKLAFSTGVLIMAQRQTALIAKQAACLDVLCKGRFRLEIGVGWNEVEFVGLNENFRNCGRPSQCNPINLSGRISAHSAMSRSVSDRWNRVRGSARVYAPSCFHSASTGLGEARFWKQGRS
jgi:hypothetical protein